MVCNFLKEVGPGTQNGGNTKGVRESDNTVQGGGIHAKVIKHVWWAQYVGSEKAHKVAKTRRIWGQKCNEVWFSPNTHAVPTQEETKLH